MLEAIKHAHSPQTLQLIASGVISDLGLLSSSSHRAGYETHIEQSIYTTMLLHNVIAMYRMLSKYSGV